MSKKLFLVFSQVGQLPPKLYKRQSNAMKLLQKNKEYTLKQYQHEISASNALLIHEMEHEKFKLNSKQILIQDQLREFNNSNKIDQNIQNKTVEQQNYNKIEQLASQIGISQSQSKVNKKLAKYDTQQIVAQLNKKKQSLYQLSPYLAKILAYYTPTPSLITINPNKIYTGFFDGCSKFNPGPSGVGYYIMDRQTTVLEACWPIGSKTNNQAEFTALIYLLVDAHLNNIQNINIFGDSKITVETASGKMRLSNPNIVEHGEVLNKLLKLFPYKKFQYIQRKYNSIADKLSNEALKKKFQKQKYFQIKKDIL